MKAMISEKFSIAHRLSSSMNNRQNNLHGHTWRVDVVVEGPVGRDGFVMDFVLLKEKVKAALDGFDRKVILGNNDVLLFEGLKKLGVDVRTIEGEPTAENLAKVLYRRLERELGKSVYLEKVVVWRSDNAWVECNEADAEIVKGG
uniref:6-carboxy-5,6,7,8-tetrahydropterin synthase n=1 Tax=candidate division CPR3 bacterium TaxID=2268181 RepID=A0A7V3J9J7_UNCC3